MPSIATSGPKWPLSSSSEGLLRVLVFGNLHYGCRRDIVARIRRPELRCLRKTRFRPGLPGPLSLKRSGTWVLNLFQHCSFAHCPDKIKVQYSHYCQARCLNLCYPTNLGRMSFDWQYFSENTPFKSLQGCHAAATKHETENKHISLPS
jgi:hypothetical protein